MTSNSTRSERNMNENENETEENEWYLIKVINVFYIIKHDIL